MKCSCVGEGVMLMCLNESSQPSPSSPQFLFVMATSADCIFVHASSRSLPSTSISSSDVNLPPMVRINDELTKVDEKISSKYSLKDIVDNFELKKKNQKAKERYHRKRKRKDEEDKEDEEDHFLNYAILKDWLEEKCKCRQRYDDIVLTDSNVEVFLNLEPIFCSVKIRPDLVMYRHDPKIPVLIVEVHSSPYARSLRKLALVLVEQLRYLRNGNIDLFKWTGFCFPKASPPSCVTEMTVVWNSNDLVFEVNCSFLQLDDVKSRIQGVFFTQKTTSFNIPRRLMGFPLNRKDLIFGFGKDAYQIRSKSSIIVCDGKFFYKHIVDNFESRAIEEMIAVDEKSDKYLLPSKKYSYRKGPCFYVYPKLLSPMSRAEAKRCLPNFVTSVAKAINALHTTLERAHLDIRLENVCFSEKFEGEITYYSLSLSLTSRYAAFLLLQYW